MRRKPSKHAVMWLFQTVVVTYVAIEYATHWVVPVLVVMYGIACYLFGGNHVMDQWIDYMEAEEKFLRQEAARVQKANEFMQKSKGGNSS